MRSVIVLTLVCSLALGFGLSTVAPALVDRIGEIVHAR